MTCKDPRRHEGGRATQLGRVRGAVSPRVSFPLGPRAVAALVEAISGGYSHSDISTLFMRVGVDPWDPGDKVNKARRAQAVLKALRAQSSPNATRITMDLVSEVLKHGERDVPWIEHPSWWSPLVETLINAGLEWDSAALRLVPSVEGVSAAEARGLLEQRLVDLGWETAAAHYAQAVRALSAGDWESANAQIRSFLEAFIPDAAATILGTVPRSDPVASLQDLKGRGALFDGEFDFARGLWKLANPRGSHAGLSDRDEAQFRMLSATAYARFLLSRLPE
jgi:hypothetical protein